jgi:N-acyl-D-aspartate/D-glutamate deacylase
MPAEAAVHRVTGELADWYGLDAGRLAPEQRADVAVIDPAGFDGSSSQYAEAPMPGTELSRMVNRNDRTVAATIVGGQVVYEYGTFGDGFGTTMHAGTFPAAWECRITFGTRGVAAEGGIVKASDHCSERRGRRRSGPGTARWQQDRR